MEVGGAEVGAIGPGLLVYLGAGQGDGDADVTYLAEKLAGLRVFEDEDGKMSRSVMQTGGAVLVVSQFTLYGDVRRGRRPSFTEAAAPELAEGLVEALVQTLREKGLHVATGRFRTTMRVRAQVEGPVTILLDSRKTF